LYASFRNSSSQVRLAARGVGQAAAIAFVVDDLTRFVE
jgi:hypothetical protein